MGYLEPLDMDYLASWDGFLSMYYMCTLCVQYVYSMDNVS